MTGIREYLDKNRTLVNIFLVYFFLTFAIGYIDFDRRVDTFERSTEALKEVVTGGAVQPMSRRVLVPYTLYFFHMATRLPLDYIYALFRFLAFFLAFVLFHMYLKKWFDDKLAMIGTLSIIASLPLTLTNWYCVPTDIPELITFILAAMWIRDNRYKNLYFLIPIAALNKETALAMVMLYFLNGLGRENSAILIKRTFIYGLLWLIPSAILAFIFGFRTAASCWHFNENLSGLLQIFTRPNIYSQSYFLLYLCGFYWILAFRDFRKKDIFLKRAIPMVITFFLVAFIKAGRISEVRMFMPFYVFIIPLGLMSLFGKYTQNNQNNTGDL